MDKRPGLSQFQELAEKESSEILSALSDQENEFLLCLQENTADRDSLAYALIALGKVCEDPLQDSLQPLLINIFQSKKFSHILLPQYLVGLLQTNDSTHKQSLNSLLGLLCCFNSLLPALSVDIVSILLPLLKIACKRLFKDDRDTLKSLIEKIIGLDEEKNTFANSFSRPDILKAAESIKLNYKEPPNNYRDIAIFPTIADVQEETFLRPVIPIGKYADADHYLDVYFRLLREDYVEPLRTGIELYRAWRRSKARLLNSRELKIYLNVKIIGKLIEDEIIYVMQFEKTNFKGVEWEHNKRLLTGSLVCLSLDHFKTMFFATVQDRKVEDLKDGKFTLSFTNDFPFSDNIDYSDKYFVMLETDVCFETFRHSLATLQKMNDNFPLQKYILFVENPIDYPEYLQIDTVYDIYPLQRPFIEKSSPIPIIESPNYKLLKPVGRTIHTNDTSMVTVLDPNSWPPETDVGLDKSQYEALKGTLTKELAIIQGPPGTGKTFIGLKIVELLLHNKTVRASSPILVVCYTNHALDQFLEGIMQFSGNITRVGGGCKSENMKDCLLNSKIRSNEAFTTQKQAISQIENKINLIKSKINASSSNVLGEEDLHSVMESKLLWSLEKCTQYLEKPIKGKIILDWLEVNHMTVWNSNALSEDEQWQTVRRLNEKRYVENQLDSWGEMREMKVGFVRNVWQLEMPGRWGLYKYWLSKFIIQKQHELSNLHDQLQKEGKMLKKTRNKIELSVLRSSDVVGMTTTGAAKHHDLLEIVRPEVVVVEEAAEILEPHVVTSMTSSTKHLILIGDHQQLRPKVSIYELAAKFHLDLSLFERMVNNGLEYYQLNLQHRMRPEIASLIVPHIYPSLENHRSVLNMENIKGVTKNVFFVSHDKPGNENCDSNSRLNLYEAEFLVSLCKYLMQQGYQSSQITILTTYSGQLTAIRGIVKDQESYKDVKVAVVDNYQGEENDIILLSFVRSNRDGKIGFLKIPNRVCVALSRAKKGLFCIGNFSLYARVSKLWRSITRTLEGQDLIGTSLHLECQNHPGTFTEVSQRSHFIRVQDGGCSLPCNTMLYCGHSCGMKCHPFDPEHKAYKCLENCEKMCRRKHKCVAKCYELCKKCNVKVEKLLSCGHAVTIQCWKSDVETKCTEVVTVQLLCGHNMNLQCNQRENVNYYTPCCNKQCETKLKCGHICRGTCAGCHHGRLHELCRERCNRKLICGHLCKSACCKPCPPCDMPCENSCAHGTCKRKCGSCCILCSEHPCLTDMSYRSDLCGSVWNSQLETVKSIVHECGKLFVTKNIQQGWVKSLVQMKSHHLLLFTEMISPLFNILKRNNDLKFVTLIRCLNVIVLAKIMFELDALYNRISCYSEKYTYYGEKYKSFQQLLKFVTETKTLITKFFNTEYLTASEIQFEAVIREILRYEYMIRFLNFLCTNPNKYYSDMEMSNKAIDYLCVAGAFQDATEKSYVKLVQTAFPENQEVVDMSSKKLSVFSLSFAADNWQHQSLDVSELINFITSSVNYIEHSCNSPSWYVKKKFN